jgi:hypothetical protein
LQASNEIKYEGGELGVLHKEIGYEIVDLFAVGSFAWLHVTDII